MVDSRIGVNGFQFHMRVDHNILALFSVCEAKGHVLANLPLPEITKWGGENRSVLFGLVFSNEEHQVGQYIVVIHR
jgi:hypothetical protein